MFRGKTVLLPCDDPEWSNFTKYFALNFTTLGLKKLISTSYAPAANANAAFYEATLFETGDPKYDADLSMSRGRVFILTAEDMPGSGSRRSSGSRW